MRVKCLAQEHNVVPRPGLELGPFDTESSALTLRPPVRRIKRNKLSNVSKKLAYNSTLLRSQRVLINNYPAKSCGILPYTKPTRLQAELAKIRPYSARLSRIIVLLFYKLSMKRFLQREKLWLCSALQEFRTNFDNLLISQDICFVRITDCRQ